MAKNNSLKEIRRAALPLFLSNSIFGIGILEYPVGRPHRVLSCFYIAAIWIVYTLAAIYSGPYLKVFGRRIGANAIIVKVYFGSHVFLTISSHLLGLRRNAGLHSVIHRILAANRTMQKIGIDPNYGSVSKSQLRQIILYLLIIWTAMTIVNVSLLYHETVTIDKIAFLVVLNFPILVISLGDATFFNVIQYTTLKLKRLNDLMKCKLTSTPDCSQHANLLKYYRIPVNAQRYSNSVSFLTNIMNDDLYFINAARIAHLNFTKVCETTVQILQYHILSSMIVAILILTGCFYHSYALLMSGYIKKIESYVFAILGSMATYNAVRIYLFAKYSSEVTEESVAMGDIIAEMYDENNINQECKIEIQQFEEQLIQRPLNIQVAQITINYSFIQKAIQIVATNLVILTQCGNISIEMPDKQ